MPGAVSGLWVQPCYSKSPSLAKLFTQFPEIPEENSPLLFDSHHVHIWLIIQGKWCFPQHYQGKKDQASHPAGPRVLVVPQPGQGAGGEAVSSHTGLPTVT